MARGLVVMSARAAVLGLAVVALAVVPASAGADVPRVTLAQAASDVEAATASDPTLSNLAADLSTPTLEVEGAQVFAALGALNRAYGGGAGDFLAAGQPGSDLAASASSYEPGWAMGAFNALTEYGDSTVTAADAGGETTELASLEGLLGSGGEAAAAPIAPELAAGAAVAAAFTVSYTGTTYLLDWLFGGNDGINNATAPSGTPGSGYDPYGVPSAWRWVALRVPSSGQCLWSNPGPVAGYPSAGEDPGNMTVQSCDDGTTEPALPQGEDYLLEAKSSTDGHWVVDLNDEGPLTRATAVFMAGWIPTETPGRATVERGTADYYNRSESCQHPVGGVDPYPGGGYYTPSCQSAVVRTASQMPLGLPHTGTVPPGTPAAPQAPITTKAQLHTAIAALPGALILNPEAGQLLDSGMGTAPATGSPAPGEPLGSPVAPPGELTIPQPRPGELGADYVHDLDTAGFTNVTLVTLTSPDVDFGPDAVTSESPAAGEAAAPDTPITVNENPDDAPEPGTTGTIGAPGCGLTPPTSSIDLGPLTGLHLGSAFPFSVIPWIENALSGIAPAGSRPQLSLSVFGTTVASGDSLAPLDPVFSAVRTFLAISLWLGVIWSLWRRTFGGAREV